MCLEGCLQQPGPRAEDTQQRTAARTHPHLALLPPAPPCQHLTFSPSSPLLSLFLSFQHLLSKAKGNSQRMVTP